jgi:hypothetical protein
MLFMEIIPVYNKNDLKSVNTLCGQNAAIVNVKACGTYRYQLACERLRNDRSKFFKLSLKHTYWEE